MCHTSLGSNGETIETRYRCHVGRRHLGNFSVVAMQSLGLPEVLTNDRHFAQEGFTVLFP